MSNLRILVDRLIATTSRYVYVKEMMPCVPVSAYDCLVMDNSVEDEGLTFLGLG
jgi:hypothetical protein